MRCRPEPGASAPRPPLPAEPRLPPLGGEEGTPARPGSRLLLLLLRARRVRPLLPLAPLPSWSKRTQDPEKVEARKQKEIAFRPHKLKALADAAAALDYLHTHFSPSILHRDI